MFQQTATKLMVRFGVTPDLSSVVTQGMSLQGAPLGNMMKSTTGDETEKLSSSSYASRTKKVINNFLQTPILEQGEAKNPQVCNNVDSLHPCLYYCTSLALMNLVSCRLDACSLKTM